MDWDGVIGTCEGGDGFVLKDVSVYFLKFIGGNLQKARGILG
jgi:hypothetical protein